MSPWVTSALPGVLMLVCAGILFGQARPARLPAVFLSLTGLFLVLVAVFPALARAVLPNQVRVFMGAVSLTHLFITLESVRRNALKERYALLWLGTGIVLLGFAIDPEVIAWLAAVTGMHYSSAIMLVVFGFVILIAYHVSLVLSENEDDRRRFSQEIALLRERVEQLERERGESGRG